jgi:hypothetical protein
MTRIFNLLLSSLLMSWQMLDGASGRVAAEMMASARQSGPAVPCRRRRGCCARGLEVVFFYGIIASGANSGIFIGGLDLLAPWSCFTIWH